MGRARGHTTAISLLGGRRRGAANELIQRHQLELEDEGTATVALESTRLAFPDGLFQNSRLDVGSYDWSQGQPPLFKDKEKCHILIDKAGIALVISKRADKHGRLFAEPMIAETAEPSYIDPTDEYEWMMKYDVFSSRNSAESNQIRYDWFVLPQTAWQELELQQAIESYSAVLQEVMRLRLGGWHIKGEHNGGESTLVVYNPLDESQQTQFLFPSVSNGYYDSKGKWQNERNKVDKRNTSQQLQQLQQLTEDLRKMPSIPRRHAASYVEAVVSTHRELQAPGIDLGPLVQARWPEANGTVLVILLERANELVAQGVDTMQAIEQAGTTPLM